MTAPNLEQIIADHERVRMMRLATCRCGWEEPIYDRDVTALHAAHVVAAIRDSGYTVIALPEAEGPDEDGQLWFGDYDIRVDMTGKRDDPHLYVYDGPRSPDEVCEHAAALLAAAQAAERNNP